jgi:hypothetical protein
MNRIIITKKIFTEFSRPVYLISLRKEFKINLNICLNKEGFRRAANKMKIIIMFYAFKNLFFIYE